MKDLGYYLKQIEAAQTPEKLLSIKKLIPKHDDTSPNYREYLSVCGKLGAKLRYMTMTEEQRKKHYDRLSYGLRRISKDNKAQEPV